MQTLGWTCGSAESRWLQRDSADIFCFCHANSNTYIHTYSDIDLCLFKPLRERASFLLQLWHHNEGQGRSSRFTASILDVMSQTRCKDAFKHCGKNESDSHVTHHTCTLIPENCLHFFLLLTSFTSSNLAASGDSERQPLPPPPNLPATPQTQTHSESRGVVHSSPCVVSQSGPDSRYGQKQSWATENSAFLFFYVHFYCPWQTQ